MTAIVSSHPAAEHEGLNRVSKGLGFIANHIHNSRLAYAGILAAAVVLANALISPTGLVAWLVLWAIVFAVAALMAPNAQRRGAGLLEQWLQSQRDARANEQLWQLALNDHRVMSDLVNAQSAYR
ncbi:hypothetical protein E9531_01585 [Lampropedia puyangensis]|uniref:Uncharacterized protein n=1 Tax=Lampropedia puyangensis TaxID=1330072 RepID=A0A4S8FEC1_9BURK|nr:hypothetical protein [Lampropedia puyangensis]THU05265.1 hypothetical protein E9531_01585 [Lampropedia puyangensis]